MTGGSDYDLFGFWRLVLWLACAMYTVIMTARTAYSWWTLLIGDGRQSRMLRRYVQFQLLRIRLAPLRRELAMIGGYALLLTFLLAMHGRV